MTGTWWNGGKVVAILDDASMPALPRLSFFAFWRKTLLFLFRVKSPESTLLARFHWPLIF